MVSTGSLWEIIGGSSAFGVFILIALTFMSVVSWVIIFHKWREFRAVDRATRNFVQSFRRGQKMADSLGQAKSNSLSPIAKVFLAGFNELSDLGQSKHEARMLTKSASPPDTDDFEIVEMTMEKTATEELGRMEKLVVFLATTASAAPFMGLLGTVVGIMDSFWSIGEVGSASLAVVAPGIAEALLATIVGLGAAIPAVIAYNWANNKTKFINDAANSFILEFLSQAKKEAR